jgi:hypothetical protein
VLNAVLYTVVFLLLILTIERKTPSAVLLTMLRLLVSETARRAWVYLSAGWMIGLI